jgi:hypothetical protein
MFKIILVLRILCVYEMWRRWLAKWRECGRIGIQLFKTAVCADVLIKTKGKKRNMKIEAKDSAVVPKNLPLNSFLLHFTYTQPIWQKDHHICFSVFKVVVPKMGTGCFSEMLIIYLQVWMALQPRRPTLISSLLWEFQILLYRRFAH